MGKIWLWFIWVWFEGIFDLCRVFGFFWYRLYGDIGKEVIGKMKV